MRQSVGSGRAARGSFADRVNAGDGPANVERPLLGAGSCAKTNLVQDTGNGFFGAFSEVLAPPSPAANPNPSQPEPPASQAA